MIYTSAYRDTAGVRLSPPLLTVYEGYPRHPGYKVSEADWLAILPALSPWQRSLPLFAGQSVSHPLDVWQWHPLRTSDINEAADLDSNLCTFSFPRTCFICFPVRNDPAPLALAFDDACGTPALPLQEGHVAAARLQTDSRRCIPQSGTLHAQWLDARRGVLAPCSVALQYWMRAADPRTFALCQNYFSGQLDSYRSGGWEHPSCHGKHAKSHTL